MMTIKRLSAAALAAALFFGGSAVIPYAEDVVTIEDADIADYALIQVDGAAADDTDTDAACETETEEDTIEEADIEITNEGFTEYIEYKKRNIAEVEGDTVRYIDQGDPVLNGKCLNFLLGDDEERTVVLPKGKLKIGMGLKLGSNKTILAEGTKIIQTDPQKQLIRNDCIKTGYGSIENVTIDGGTWYIYKNDKMLRDTSTIRFNHGRNISIRNCTVYTNYRSHGIEIIACRDVELFNCTVKCEGKPIKGGREEAVQIDIATAETAPTCVDKSKKFVQGQTCRNITIDSCTITGARALVCNRTNTEKNRYAGNMHHNITVKNCKLIGTQAEGLVMNNVQGFKVLDNVIISKCKDTSSDFSAGMSARLFGKEKKKDDRKNYIRGNTIKGAKYALRVGAASGVSAKYGTLSVKSNNLYCKKSAKNALSISSVSKLVKKSNKCKKWK